MYICANKEQRSYNHPFRVYILNCGRKKKQVYCLILYKAVLIDDVEDRPLQYKYVFYCKLFLSLQYQNPKMEKLKDSIKIQITILTSCVTVP